MAKLILKLKKNAETLEQELTVDYESDSDALPFEHEEEHRAIIKRLLVDNAAEGEFLEINRGAVSKVEEQTGDSSAIAEQTAVKQRQ